MGGLRLKALDSEDLGVISAILQDAIIPMADMAYLPESATFVMVVNRFRWEGGEDAIAPHQRVHCALSFAQVTRVTHRGVDARHGDGFLSLLSVTTEDGHILLHLAGGGDIRLAVTAIDVTLADQGEPWPVASKPAHPVE